jgi:hypothetical protein
LRPLVPFWKSDNILRAAREISGSTRTKMFVGMMTRDARQRCHYRYLKRDLVHQVLAD